MFKAGQTRTVFHSGAKRTILERALEPWHTIFAIAAMTGLRPGEVLGLSIDDLDFEQRLIFVRLSAWYRHLILPKSTRSVATVLMPVPLADNPLCVTYNVTTDPEGNSGIGTPFVLL